MDARQEAFERIAMPHVSSLLRVARRLCRNYDAAEDLVQETMLRAWRGLNQFQEGTNARAWLFKILFHQFYSDGRKQRTALQAVALATFEQSANPAEAIEVNEALAALSPDQRAV